MQTQPRQKPQRAENNITQEPSCVAFGFIEDCPAESDNDSWIQHLRDLSNVGDSFWPMYMLHDAGIRVSVQTARK